MAGPAGLATGAVRFAVNGAPVELEGALGRRLLDVLRYDLGLTGTKEGCGEGECGACSVLLDGTVVLSCLVPVCQAAGADVRTVEGLATDGRLDSLQEAFLDAGAAQCGICTPGMLMAARSYLDRGGSPDEGSIREAIAGNLCRCTGYTKIVEAIARAAPAGGAVGNLPTGRAPGAAGVPRHVVSPVTSGPAALSPTSLPEALRLMAETGGRPIAGGTDLMVALVAGALQVDRPFIDLWGLDELRGIDLDEGLLALGALTTYTELRSSPLVAEALPILAEVAASVGAAQIQNRGTIGGNIVNASPAGDMLPVLLATDASIVLVGPQGERIVPANEFWVGYRRTARAADELVTQVRIPLVHGRRVRYRKIGTRRAQAISKVVMAVAWRDDGIAWHDVRVGLGSLAERPVRAVATEALLEGASPTPEVADRAAATIEAEIHPIDDVRSTTDYRRRVTGRILRRVILDEVGE